MYKQEQIKPYEGTGDKGKLVEEMFDNIAPTYDTLNHRLSWDIDKGWRKKAIRRLAPFSPKKMLDIATGTGDFAILAAQMLHPDQLIGADISEGMMEIGRQKVKQLGLENTISFAKEDCLNLSFQDESFDVVISRNLTWTLPEAAQAYKEWSRVLKPGGLLLNFDANYGATNFAETSDLPENHAHNQLGNSLMQECEDIKRQLPISSYLRPAWDVEELGKTGMEQISIDLGLSRRVYKEKDEFYNPTPMFAIAAKKA